MFDTIENQIKRAEHAINDLSKNPNECEWFQILLDLLKNKKSAVVYGKNGKPLRVTRIAHTMYSASFFDVYNIRRLINFEIKPKEIDEETIEIAGFGFYGKFFD